MIRDEDWLGAAHEAAFLGLIGLSSGALTPRELLGDTGLVHELLHLARAPQDEPDPDDNAERATRAAAVMLMAKDFEYRVPGWEPSGGEPGVLRWPAEDEG
jgi:hypothetical protein